MSDYIIKIIPVNPYAHIASQNVQQAVDFLKRSFEDVSAVTYVTPVFVDCGENLEKIICSSCGAEMDFDWWQESMSAACAKDFVSLELETPCCHKVSSLNDLEYYFPCGFACIEIDIFNPVTEPDEECLAAVQTLLCEQLRVIHSHL